MSNILEQEDYIKGLPDSELQRMVEQPDGQIPDFLPLSEIQRRIDMRKNYEATAQPQMPSIRDNIMAQGLASAAPQRSSTPPDYLTSALPAGGGMQGQGGMGVQGYNTGGVMRMQEGRQAPSSLKALRNGEAVVLARGENPDEFSVPELEYIGRTSPNQLGFMSNFMGDNHEYLGFGRYVPPTGNNTEPVPTETVSTEEMIDRYKILGESGFGGAGQELPLTRMEEAREETVRRIDDPDRYPYGQATPFEQDQLSIGQKTGLGIREAGLGAYDLLMPTVEAVSGEVRDAITGVATGSTEDAVQQRERAEEQRRLAADERKAQNQLEAASTYAGGMEQARLDALEAGQRLEQRQLETGTAYARGMFPAPAELTSEERAQALVNQSLLERTGIDISEYDRDMQVNQLMEENAAKGQGGFWQQARDLVTNDLGRMFSWRDDVLANKQVDPQFLRYGLDGLSNELSSNEFSEEISEGTSQNAIATDISREELGGAYGVNPNQALQDEAYAELLAGQGDVSNNLRGLIDQTRADSKQQAFYLGMAALGAGIAKGDMGGGMQEAVNIASSTTARGQDAVAPLEAALVTQGTQGPKDRIEALASMARSDAAFQAVKADILRQGRLDQQSARTLRAATLQAVTRIVQESGGYLEDVDTPQQMADFIRTVAGQLNSEVESELPASTSRLTTNPETGRQRFTAP